MQRLLVLTIVTTSELQFKTFLQKVEGSIEQKIFQ